MREGAELAADEIRREGGVEGYAFEMIVEDHESGNADVALSAGRKLISLDRVPVILSSFTAPTVAVHSLAVEQGVLMLNGGGVGDDLTGRDGLYNTRVLGSQLMPGLIRWAVESHGAERIATLYWNDAAGRAIHETAVDLCEDLGCSVVAAEPHDVGATSFGAQLARIRAADPDLLVLGSYGNDVGYIVSQARRQGISVPILGNEWTPDAQSVGGEAFEGYVAVLDQFDATETTDPEGRAFVEAYRDAYGETPEFYGANYYELVKLVLTDLVRMAVEEGRDPSAPGVLRETMEAAVADGHGFETLYGEQMILNPDGTVTKPAGVFRVVDGELVRFGLLQSGRVVEE